MPSLLDVDNFLIFFLAWLIASARLTACLLIFPLLQKSVVSGLIRAGIIAAFSILFIPFTWQAAVSLHDANNMNSAFILLLILSKEVLVGAVMGFILAMPFWIAEGFGLVIDTQSGGASAILFNQASGNESAILSGLMYQVLATWFVLMGGISWLIGWMAESFSLWSIESWWPTWPTQGKQWWLQQMDHVFAMIIVLAAPALIIMFLTEFTLGLAGRFAPSLQVFFVAFPLKCLIAMLMLSLYCSLAMTRLGKEMLGGAGNTLLLAMTKVLSSSH